MKKVRFDIVARNSLRHFTLTIMNQPATRAKTQVLTLLRGTAPKETGFNANSSCKKVTDECVGDDDELGVYYNS